MVKSEVKKKPTKSFTCWLDEWKLAGMGILLAMRCWQFWAVAIPVFLVFGIIMSLLSGGSAAFDLFLATNFAGKIDILKSGLLSLFGVGRNFIDFLLVFLVSLLQGVLISMIVLVWKRRPNQKKMRQENSEQVQNAGIIAGLAVLGSGCPTCGTALLAPVLGTIFAGSGYAVAGAVSGIITAVAIAVAVLSLKKVAVDAYVIIKAENWRKKHEQAKN